jgi:hypothetical protein
MKLSISVCLHYILDKPTEIGMFPKKWLVFLALILFAVNLEYSLTSPSPEETGHFSIPSLMSTTIPKEPTIRSSFSPTVEQQFYSQLKALINKAIAPIYHIEITPIQYPSQGDFMWFYQNDNQIFNEGTFDYISARVSPGEVPEIAQISPSGGFPNAYVQLLSGITYTLSATDQATLENALTKAQAEVQSIVSTYQQIFGEITDEDLKIAQKEINFVSSRIDYVIGYVLGYQWSGRQNESKPPLTYQEIAEAPNLKELLPQMPISATPVVTEIVNYLSLLDSANALQSKLQLGGWIARQIVNNTSYPTKDNGGMKLVNPNTGSVSDKFQVGYRINSALSSIQNDLNNTQRSIKVKITTSENSPKEIIAKVNGGVSFLTDSVNVLQFSVKNRFAYDLHRVQGTSKDSTITIEYQGYTMIPITALAWQQATNVGWYYGDPITEACKNGTQDVTGFKFSSQPSYNLYSLADGGNFGQIRNLLISNYPIVTINYQNADFKQFKKSWDENVTGNLTLFGLSKLGNLKEGTYSSKLSQGSSNSEFSVIFSASPQVTTVPQLQKTAHVIGGSFYFPIMDTPNF